MNLEKGKYYTTRSGKKVRILTIDREDPDLTVVGLIRDGDRESVNTWTITGRRCPHDDVEYYNDIVGPWLTESDVRIGDEQKLRRLRRQARRLCRELDAVLKAD